MKKNDKKCANATRAAWAGLMVGDALGAPAEFCYREDILAAYPEGLSQMVDGFGICTDRRAGEVTDDTQMAYCLHCALREAQGWDSAVTLKHYRAWLATDPPDVGAATQAALLGNPMPDSQGNGALMRVMPIALWALEHPEFDWQTAAREDASLTHPHPVCGDCNVVYIYALMQAARPGATPQGVYERSVAFAAGEGVATDVLCALQRAATQRPDYDGEHIGWVLIALQSVFYQLLRATSFREAMVDIVSAGGDTDTNAAIAGSLLALLYGRSAIPAPWLRSVRRANAPGYVALLPDIRV
ncbi:MAG: ADP-ribosylglycohydrolase family protein [Akkermansia sp.]|nr:ADP-ribosylglycohydrolase family protein [Akkermansia sp.]